MSKRTGKPQPSDGRKRTKADISGHAEPAGDEAVGDDGLTGRQHRGLAALLAEPTIARAAEVAGVAERTLRRWMAEPPFRAALNGGWRQSLTHAVGLTQKLAPAAVAALARVMQEPGGGPAAKVSAATALLKFCREGVALDDLAGRVEALEVELRAAATPQPPPAPDAQQPEGRE